MNNAFSHIHKHHMLTLYDVSKADINIEKFTIVFDTILKIPPQQFMSEEFLNYVGLLGVTTNDITDMVSNIIIKSINNNNSLTTYWSPLNILHTPYFDVGVVRIYLEGIINNVKCNYECIYILDEFNKINKHFNSAYTLSLVSQLQQLKYCIKSQGVIDYVLNYK